MTRLKVLSVIASISRRNGGPGINVVESVRHLAREQIDLDIWTTDLAHPSSAVQQARLAADDLPAGAEIANINIFPVLRGARIAYSKALGDALSARIDQYDVVRVHGMYLYPNYAAAVAAHRHGIPYIVSPHGTLDPIIRRRGRLRKVVSDTAWQRQVMRRARLLHFTTAEEARLAYEVLPPSPHRVVPNGVSLPEGNLTPSGARANEALFVGRLSQKKNIPFLLDVWSRVIGQRSQATLVVAGPDDENMRPMLISKAAELGIAERVRFVGPQYGSDKRELLDGSALWLLPSLGEDFGIAVIEAMGMGAAVIISPNVNLAMEASRAGAARVVPLDAAAWARDVVQLLDNQTERAELAARGRKFAARYDWGQVAPQFRAMFETAAGGS